MSRSNSIFSLSSQIPGGPSTEVISDFFASSLLERRIRSVAKHHNPKNTARLFQLTDFAYANVPIKNKKVFLHCKEAGNFGDISQVFLTAEILRRRRPDVQIKILIELNTKKKEEVEKIFPVADFDVEFVSRDYKEGRIPFEKLLAEGWSAIGIPVPLHGDMYYKTYHRQIYENGWDATFGFVNWSMETSGNHLSMGFDNNEEGLNFPNIPNSELTQIESPWLKQVLPITSSDEQKNYLQQTQLYQLYSHRWFYQIVGLYSILAIEKNNEKPIDLVCPFEWTLKQLIEWKILDLSILKSNNIGKISLVTTAGVETIELNDEPGAKIKELRILSGPLRKVEMQAVQQHSQPFYGCTGDLSYAESVVANKLPFYEIESHKLNFYKSIIATAKELKLETLVNFFELVLSCDKRKDDIYASHIPKRKNYWDQAPPNSDMTDPRSFYRKAIDESFSSPTAEEGKLKLIPLLIRESAQIAELYNDANLLQESKIFNETIQRDYNFEDRFLAIIDRALAIQNFPELFPAEQKAWQKFKDAIQNLEAKSEEAVTQVRNIFLEAFQEIKMNIKEVEPSFNISRSATPHTESSMNSSPSITSRTLSDSASNKTTEVDSDSENQSTPRNK